MSKSPRYRRPLIEALEPRLLFSATADIAVFDDGNSEGQYLAAAAQNLDLLSIYNPDDIYSAVDTSSAGTVIFVDTSVDNYQVLISDIKNNLNDQPAAIVYLDSAGDGITQISDYLAGVSSISAVHVISHGGAGSVQLGSQVLNETSIGKYQQALSGWKNSLTEDTDILLYGCDVAANQSGLDFLRELSNFTGADVAASNDLTGNAANADWDLEARVGHIETAALFSFDQIMAWQGTLAAPTVDGHIPNQTATEDTLYTYTFDINTFGDADGDTLTYSAQIPGGTPLPGWLEFDPDTRTFSGIPSNGDVGNITIEVIASDGTGTISEFFDLEVENFGSTSVVYESSGSSTDTQIITAAVPFFQSFFHDNAAPTFTIDTIVLQLVKDPTAAAQTITVTLLEGTHNGTVVKSASIFSGDINTGLEWEEFDFSNTVLKDNQLYFIRIDSTSNDGQVKAAIHNANVYANGSFHSSTGSPDTDRDLAFQVSSGPNFNPDIAIPIPNQSATENVAFTFQFDENTFSDPDAGDTLTYTATLANGNSLPVWLHFDAATRTFSGTPDDGDVGTFSVKVTANDGNGGVVDGTFDLLVNNVNDDPFLNTPLSDQNATEDSTFSYTFPANTFGDADVGTTLTYTAQLNGGGALPSWLSFNTATRTFSGMPLNASVGTVSIDVIASDGNGGTVTDTFNIVVANTNDAPTVANVIPNQNATEDSAFNFQFSANTFNDQDAASSLTYSAQLAGGSALPTWLSFNAATRTFSGTPANADVGTLSVQVTANDGVGGTVSDTFDITIANTNDAPTVANAIPNQTATENSLFNFSFASNTFNDQDLGTSLTYTAQLVGGGALPSWLSFDSATRTFSGTPLNAHVGTVSIDVIANDGNGGTVTDTFNITIANTNDAPTVDNLINDQNATQNVAFNFQFDANTFSDVDGNTLSYSAHLVGGAALPAWLNFDSATRTFSGTPANGDVGTLSIEVIANDDNGGTVTEMFDVVVANANDAPTVVITPTDYYAFEQVVINLHGTGIGVADVDGDALTITLTGTYANSNLAATVGATGVVIVSGVNTNTLILSGTAAQLNDLFAGNNGGTLTYRLLGDTPPTSDTLIISASDGSLSGSDTATINITAVNDAPENTVPGAQVTNEDTALVFSADNGNQIHVNDLDVGSGDLEVTLSVTNGTLTLATVTGLILTTGDGAADSSLVMRGTQININAALAALTFNPTANYTGSAVLTITTNDLGNNGNGGALTVSDNINITINASSDVPVVANAIGNQTATEDSAFNFQFATNTFADVDGDTLAYTAQLAGGGALPAWLSFDAATRTFSGTPLNAHIGTVSIDVIANDGNGGTVTDTFDITVANSNDAPTIANTIGNQTATEDLAFNFQFDTDVFADVDGDTLTYTAQFAGGGALPTWLSFDAATRTFSGTPLNTHVGTISIDVIASDGNGGNVTDTFDITVANTNDAPTIASAIGNQTATEDSAFNFQFAASTFADVDGDTLAYTAQLAGGGALPTWLSFDAATRTFSGTPENGDVGLISIDVIANDGNGGTITDTFDITVANTNDVPTVANSIGDQTATEDSAFNFQFASNTFADVDGDTLAYTAQLAGGGALPSWLSFDAATRTFSGTPLNANVGTVSIDVIASDGNGGNVTDTFDITVANTNDAPTIANAIGNQTATEDSAFNFQFAANSFADVDGDTLTYTAQFAGGGALPAWLSFDAATRTFSGTPLNAHVGTVSIDVIASDGNGGMVTDTFNITVANSNDAPTVANAIGNQTATEDLVFNFQFDIDVFADVDGDTLTYTAQLAGGGVLPTWLSFDTATRTFSGTPLNAHIGTVSIDVIANDGNGGTVTDTFDITVENTNDAPIIANAIGNQTATEDSAFNFQFAANTFSDVDGDTLTYNAQLAGGGALPTWLSFDAATRTFSGTPLNAHVGTVSIDVIASDGNGGLVTDTFDITVVNANDAPTIANTIGNQTATEGSAFNFQFAANTFSDVDGDTLTYTAQLAGGGALPAWLSFDAATRTFSGTPTNGDVGNLSIQVIASDGSASAVAQFQLAVLDVNDAPLSNGIADIYLQAGAAPLQLNLQEVFHDLESGTALLWSLVENTNSAITTSVQIDPVTGVMTLTFSPQEGGSSLITLRAQDAAGAIVETQFRVTLTAAVIEVPVTPPVDPLPPTEVPIPPAEPPVPPVERPPVAVVPPVTPPVDSITPGVPEPLPSGGGAGVPTNPDVDESAFLNPTGTSDQSLIIESERIVNGLDDKSSRDIERAEEALRERYSLDSSLNAALSLSGLIAPDSGFAPWEAADFDTEVRRLRAQMDAALEEEQGRKALVAGVTFSLTTGLLIWSLRASSLLLTMMSMLPLWRGLDPLPILDEVNKKKKELEQQRKDREREDKNAKEVGYLFDHSQNKKPR